MICKMNLIYSYNTLLINNIIINNSGTKFILSEKKKKKNLYIYFYLLKIILNQPYILIFSNKNNIIFKIKKNQLIGNQIQSVIYKKQLYFLDKFFLKNIKSICNNTTKPFFFQNNLNQFLGIKKNFELNYLHNKHKSYFEITLSDYLDFNLLITK